MEKFSGFKTIKWAFIGGAIQAFVSSILKQSPEQLLWVSLGSLCFALAFMYIETRL